MAGIFVALYRIMVVLTGSVTDMMSKFANQTAAAGGSVSSSGGVSAGQVLGGGMTMFTNFPEKEMGAFVVISLTIITLSNLIAAKLVGGGDRYMFYFYGAIFCTLTGLVLLIGPLVVGLFFSPEGLQAMASSGV
jgi:flagellar protein FlaJ